MKQDLNAHDMRLTMLDFADRAKHSTCQGSVVAVLSHGGEGALQGVDEDSVDVEVFTGYLNLVNCPNLKDKPKLFILTACRKRVVPACRQVSSESTGSSDSVDVAIVTDGNTAQSIEGDDMIIDSDVLVVYSTMPGQNSYRHRRHGTAFIQAFDKIFRKYKKQKHPGIVNRGHQLASNEAIGSGRVAANTSVHLQSDKGTVHSLRVVEDASIGC